MGGRHFSAPIKMIGLLFAMVLTFGFGTPSSAHFKGFTYIYLNVSETELGGRYEVLLPDLLDRVDLDADGDGVISKAEIDAQAETLYRQFEGYLTVLSNGQPYEIVIDRHEYLDVPFGSYVLLQFKVDGLSPVPDTVEMAYDGRIWDDPAHQTMLLIESNEKIGLEGNEAHPTLIFAPGQDQRQVSMLGETRSEAFQRLLKQGVIHIAIGYDHIVFLLTLLLPAVLLLNQGRWAPTERPKDAFLNLLTVVTLFTIAHSITLSLAALDLIRLPGVLVESLIAFSIVVMAFANLMAWRSAGTKSVVFGLGLLHGFGFAYVLAPLNIAQSTLVVSLLAFNLGVELGQLVIVMMVFPVLYLLRRWTYYVPVILWGVSALAILAGLRWMYMRISGYCGGADLIFFGQQVC